MDRRSFLATAAALPAATMLGGTLARADDHLKWAVFTPDSEVTFRTVMKPFAETVQRETNNAVVFDLFPNGALGRNPGQQPQMVLDGVADVAWVIPSYSPGRFPDTEVLELPGMFKDLREVVPGRHAAESAQRVQRLRRFLCNRDVGHGALFDPHQLSGQLDRRSQGQDHPRVEQKRKRRASRAFGAVPIGMPVTEIPEGDQPPHDQRHDVAPVAVLRFRARSRHQQSLLHRSRRRSARRSDEQEEVRRAAAIRSRGDRAQRGRGTYEDVDRFRHQL